MITSSTVPSFSRLETRMTADINVILQLLQRQIAPVPPAYTTVSSGTLPAESSGQYGTGTPVLHGMYPISTIQIDSRVPTQVQESTNWSRCCSGGFCPTIDFRNDCKNVISLLQSSSNTDVKFSKKSEESISNGTHVTAASVDTTFLSLSRETESHAESLPPQPSVNSSIQKPKLRGIPHCPSLPENLDIFSGPTEIQKQLSDPVLPVAWRPSEEADTCSGFSYFWTVMWTEGRTMKEFHFTLLAWLHATATVIILHGGAFGFGLVWFFTMYSFCKPFVLAVFSFLYLTSHELFLPRVKDVLPMDGAPLDSWILIVCSIFREISSFILGRSRVKKKSVESRTCQNVIIHFLFHYQYFQKM